MFSPRYLPCTMPPPTHSGAQPSDLTSSHAAPVSSRPAARSTHAAPSRRRNSVISVLPLPWSLSRKLQRKLQLLVHAAQQILSLCPDRVIWSRPPAFAVVARDRVPVFEHRYPDPRLRIRQRQNCLDARI